ncbi:muramoyltetrapeptide carboxypeptidase [Kitasatospora sp. MMS16-BH015]|uniref:S66 peptidase family protein n=1 Tax=Kitasatospora sp. MMS16-BH015 TaxID=2018025 RepID=UPI000CA1CB7E|nr:S66 peptidase family protein [Kitasatospora sp. MMS16-BH015]AUG80210.1 muramoyltetrapeptide carboxypeptidase [Kitasatospora sp. MMS16-BH015]
MPAILRPRALRPGDLVVVTAPSGQLEPGEEPMLARGVAMLERMGFRVRVSPMVDPARRRWWASGTPAEQAAELNGLLRDPQVRAVVAHTGGHTTIGYLDLVDLDAVRADPKPILGYSDISLLNLALHARTGLVGFHADLATHGFGGDWYTLGDEARRGELLDLYTRVLTKAEAPGLLPAHGSWETWRPGRAQGPLLGGLLSRLVLLQSTPFALPAERFDGAVLFWEEVRRPVERVWGDLQALRLSGVLDRIAGLVVGIPNEVTPYGEAGLREVVLDVLGERDIPVLGQVDFGHNAPNLPLPVGVRAELDADLRTLSLVEAAVS